MPKQRPETPEDERIYIPEASALLDRQMGTLRKWEAENVLPAALMPRRGKRNWRYWTMEEIEGIKEWMAETDRRPGSALPQVSSDPEKVTAQIHAMRRPRKKKPVARTQGD